MMFDRTKQGAVWVISGDKPINSETVPELRTLIEECLSEGQPKLVLNLQQVALIDSAGLETLCDMHQRCSGGGGTLEIAAPTPLCQEILTATRVANRFIVFDSVVSAVGSFAR